MQRRDVLKWGGAALASSCVSGVTWPLKVSAAGKANPRGTARSCIFIELGGAISPQDTLDYKETWRQPKDLDVRKVANGLYLSKTLFPQLSDKMNRVSLVRSCRAAELVHFNGQYHTQAGRALAPAIAKEIPAWGSVIAYEMESRRKESDTFPAYISTSLGGSNPGTLGSGFLPPRCSVLDFDARGVLDTFGGNGEGVNNLLEERWNQLAAWSEISHSDRMGDKATDFQAFYGDAYRILNDPRWNKTFQVSDQDKNRYGDDNFGLGLILARNAIAADAGTRIFYVYDTGWDHHTQLFDRKQRVNHYTKCAGLDKGVASLLDDLSAMPGREPGKTLLDETLVVAKGEFGRTPEINPNEGRHHWRFIHTALFAGGGVKGGRVLGKTDDVGAYVVDTGWKHQEQPWMDNVVATIYSALGIDWLKRIDNTPSGRAYDYVQSAPLGQSEFISTDSIDDLFV